MSDSLRPPWTVAHQVSLSMRFPRQEYWCRLPFPSGDLPDPRIESASPVLAGKLFTTEPPGKPEHLQKSPKLWLVSPHLLLFSPLLQMGYTPLPELTNAPWRMERCWAEPGRPPSFVIACPGDGEAKTATETSV